MPNGAIGVRLMIVSTVFDLKLIDSIRFSPRFARYSWPVAASISIPNGLESVKGSKIDNESTLLLVPS